MSKWIDCHDEMPKKQHGMSDTYVIHYQDIVSGQSGSCLSHYMQDEQTDEWIWTAISPSNIVFAYYPLPPLYFYGGQHDTTIKIQNHIDYQRQAIINKMKSKV